MIMDYKFEDYVKAKCDDYDIHPNITEANSRIHSTNRLSNVIYYGPDGVGKYSCALDYIRRFSPSNLAYEKRMTVDTSKGEVVIKISDVHFEIDIGLLGCNAKHIWSEIIKHINDVVALRKEKKAFVLCKGFHEIHPELLDSFYSYMQTTNRSNRIAYVILTNTLSFLPDTILKRCITFSVARPSRQMLSRMHKVGRDAETHNIVNLRQWKNGSTGHHRRFIVDDVVEMLCNMKSEDDTSKFDFIELRDKLYCVFVLNHSAWATIWEILSSLLALGKVPADKENEVVDETYRFLELFSNNYRPIYHLERYTYFLATIVNEL